MKKFLSIILIVLMVFSIVSIVPFTASASGEEVTITFSPGDKSFVNTTGNPWYINPLSEDGAVRKTAKAGEIITVNCSYYWARTPDGNYYATGWKLQGDSSGKIYLHGDKFTVPDHDVTFVADWHEKCVVTFIFNGPWSSFDLSRSQVSVNEAADSNYKIYSGGIEMGYPGFFREGYVFAGWVVKGANDNKLYQKGDTYNLTKDTTFIAQWIPKLKVEALSCAARTATAEKVKWKAIPKAEGYLVQITNAKGAWSTSKYVKSNSYTFTNLVSGTNYKFRVRVYSTVNGKKYFGAWSNTLSSPTLPTCTSLSKVTSAKKSFNAQWKANKTVTGYQIQYATNNKFTGAGLKTVKGASKLKLTVSSLKGGTKYFVRIRTYKTIGGKNYYSTWSVAKTVTTKK